MQNARDNGNTHAIPSTSRRHLLAGASAALVAGAAIACQAEGDTAKSGPAMPAFNAAGDDAALLTLAAEFWRHQAGLEAWNAGHIPAAEGERHNAAWWDCCRAMTGIAPRTTAGNAAKAAVALRALEMVQDCEHDVEELVRAALAENAGRPQAGTAPDPDAELIALCDRLVAWETKFDAIYLAIPDDGEAERMAAAMAPEYDEIKRRLYALEAPRTLAGQRAFARAALATAQRASDGGVILDDGGGLGSYLAFGLAHAMAGEDRA
jgi:hypothetical protein